MNFAHFTKCGGETTDFHEPGHTLSQRSAAAEGSSTVVGHTLLGHWLTTLRNHFDGVVRKSPKAVPEPCRAAGVPTTKQSSRANRANCRSLALAHVLLEPSHVWSRWTGDYVND